MPEHIKHRKMHHRTAAAKRSKKRNVTMMKKMITGIMLAAAMVASPAMAQEKCCHKGEPTHDHASHELSMAAGAGKTNAAAIVAKVSAAVAGETSSEAQVARDKKMKAYLAEARKDGHHATPQAVKCHDCKEVKAKAKCAECTACDDCEDCDNCDGCTDGQCAQKT
jgi:hypothetical protein